MKKFFLAVLTMLAVIVGLWLGGYQLSVLGFFAAGRTVFAAGSAVCLLLFMFFTGILIFGEVRHERLLSVVIAIPLLAIFVGVRTPFVTTVDSLYVQNVDNPWVAARVEEIKSDPEKVRILHDFLTGKQIPSGEFWIVRELNPVVRKMAIRRIFGVDMAVAEEINQSLRFPIIGTYYRINPDRQERINLAETK